MFSALPGAEKTIDDADHIMDWNFLLLYFYLLQIIPTPQHIIPAPSQQSSSKRGKTRVDSSTVAQDRISPAKLPQKTKAEWKKSL